MSRPAIYLLVLLCTLSSGFAQAQKTAAAAPRTIEWTDLMPEEDLKLSLTRPQGDHSSRSDEELAEDRPTTYNPPRTTSSFEDQVTSAIERAMAKPDGSRPWEDGLVST